ncbi:MAG TPA: hypothetical protein VGN32_03185 [Ktedonobacterales bacterium]|nr:hypothetical protein [Ktedonobacterales bacterium]
MSEGRLSELDRLFARYRRNTTHVAVPDAWSPPWQPRGKWWTHASAPQLWRASAAATVRAWQRIVRPARRG